MVVAWGWGEACGISVERVQSSSFDDKVPEMDNSDGCTTKWMYVIYVMPLNCTLKNS